MAEWKGDSVLVEHPNTGALTFIRLMIRRLARSTVQPDPNQASA